MPFEKKYGVLYKLDYKSGGDTDFSKDSILPIGLQYFNRPGKQNALVIAMQDLRDLHKHRRLERVFFRHDTEASRLVYTLSQFGRQFITDDPFAKMVETICAEDKYSKKAVMLAYRIYSTGVDFERFVEEVKRHGFEIVESPRVVYPEELFAKEFDEWKRGGADRYIHRIIIQAMMQMPLSDLQ